MYSIPDLESIKNMIIVCACRTVPQCTVGEARRIRMDKAGPAARRWVNNRDGREIKKSRAFPEQMGFAWRAHWPTNEFCQKEALEQKK